jgi:glucose/arabinose dehydrogenase
MPPLTPQRARASRATPTAPDAVAAEATRIVARGPGAAVSPAAPALPDAVAAEAARLLVPGLGAAASGGPAPAADPARLRAPGLAASPLAAAAIAAVLGLAAALVAAPVAGQIVPAAGYYALTWATGVPQPTAMAWGPDGWLYVAHLDGDVTAHRDTDGNGQADTTVVFSSGLVWPLGLCHFDGHVYVTSLTRLTRYTDTNGDRVADLTTTLVDTIPSGRHWTTAVVPGPDSLLYVGVGSQKNLDINTRPWASTVLRFEPDGTFVDVFAEGFRNPYDLVFHDDGSLFGSENGAAPNVEVWNCDEAPDELNWIRPGLHYGFPYCHGVGDCADVSAECDPPPCGAGDCQWMGGCDSTHTPPLLRLDPHSSSNGLCFGNGFTGFDGNDLFIAQFGQSEFPDSCFTAFGHKIVRVRLEKIGDDWIPASIEDFATGLTRPLDIVVGPDGALYVCDYALGRIIRIFKTQPGGVEDEPRGDGGPGGSDGRPAALRLVVAPNPATRSARMIFGAGEAPRHAARVHVFDAAGRRVADLGTFAAGVVPDWNLEDAAGRRVAPGLYFVRVESGGRVASARLVVSE